MSSGREGAMRGDVWSVPLHRAPARSPEGRHDIRNVGPEIVVPIRGIIAQSLQQSDLLTRKSER